MEFIETSAFTRWVSDYLDDDQYRHLQVQLAAHPEGGRLIPGTGGLRKLRWADARRGKGRRGGLRVIYYYFLSDQQIWLMTLYDKDEAADLTRGQKRALQEALATELTSRIALRARKERRRH